MSRAWWSCVCACALWGAAEAVVGGGPAAAPEPDAAVVFLQHRGLSARVEGVKDDKIGYYSFLGIRYAEPPVGPRRFQRPFSRFLTGDVAAKKPCQPCPQPNPRRSGSIMGSEDCLCLSVYTPKMPGEERGSPVIFFIHGGNYRTGSANMYGGQHLNQKDTILVTMQYRLGSLGFLSTGQKDASGNAGLFDINAAMEWVTEYITFFGGDPSRIVVMGQGSGGSAASLMALSGEGRAPRGLAALSGAPLSASTVRPDPGRHARSLASETNCPKAPAERLLACLRKMPSEQIVKADSQLSMNAVDTDKFLDEISGRSGAGARVEGIDDLRGLPPLISESPTDSLKNKRMRCPMLTGVTSAETSRAVYGKYNTFLSDNLKKLSDFIEKEVVGGLRSLMTGVEALVPVEVPKVAIPLAGYYQATAKNTANVAEGLAKIAEATADALFNFPAYQSVKSWSAGAPAFLYSFEFSGNLTRGSHFLPGVALADDQTEMKERTGPSHGDELAYIFEPLDDEGNSVAGEVSSTDSRVRDAFISLIAKFAHSLAPVEKNNTKMSSLPFSEKSEQFIKIGEQITIDKDFRFCQMGLWGSMTDRVTGALCKNVFGNLLNIAKLPVELPGKLPIDVPNLPSLMGNKQTSASGAKTTPKTVLGLPFRIGRK